MRNRNRGLDFTGVAAPTVSTRLNLCICGKGFLGPRGGRCNDCQAAEVHLRGGTTVRAHCPYCGVAVTCTLRHFSPALQRGAPVPYLKVTAVLKGDHVCAVRVSDLGSDGAS